MRVSTVVDRLGMAGFVLAAALAVPAGPAFAQG